MSTSASFVSTLGVVRTCLADMVGVCARAVLEVTAPLSRDDLKDVLGLGGSRAVRAGIGLALRLSSRLVNLIGVFLDINPDDRSPSTRPREGPSSQGISFARFWSIFICAQL